MKLRLNTDSVRLRLGPEEVQQLATAGVVRATVRFGIAPDDRLVYSVTAVDRETFPTVDFNNSQIAVWLSRQVVLVWANSNEVGISFEQPIGDDRKLTVLIEKDFACMHGEEESTDVFPNPLAT